MSNLAFSSWYAPESPRTFTPRIFADRRDADASTILGLPVALVEPRSFAWRVPAVGVASLRLRPPRLRTQSFFFDAPQQPVIGPPVSSPGQIAIQPSKTRRATRPAPPSDIVKLEDRLRFALEPPLEAVLGHSLPMPFHPFPFQIDGIAFLYAKYGAVLADEMGLGKTMQAITTVRLLLHAAEVRRVLLLCPKPLITNWKREFAQWAPEVPVSVIEGSQADRKWQWNQQDTVVTLANYEVVLRDRAAAAAAPRYDLMILDEAQRIKNRLGATHQAVCSVRRRRSWALTGTPIENSTDDLVGIFEFVSPGHLSPGMRPRRIARAVAPFLLRRTKDQVLEDLPPKLIRDAEVQLTPEQYRTYKMAEDEGIIKLDALGKGLSVQHVFELILRLKQICNFDPVTGESAKLARLEADLEEVAASGRKAIIFSQWVQTLEKLSERLARFNPVEYHGKIPSRRRDAVIEKFRDDPDCHVILMSYGAGSVGLNLQFAGYVFLFDRWWNPAVEDQAINRAHRIGAAGPVTVTRFLTVNSIEERINAVLDAKRELFDTIFSQNQDGEHKLGLTQDEIFGLFDLHSPKGRVVGK